MTLPLVLVTHTLPPGWSDLLQGQADALVGPLDAIRISPQLEARLEQAAGLFTLLTIPVGEQLLAQAPRLRVVSNMAVGVDNIDLQACTRRGIRVGNTPGVLTEGTAKRIEFTTVRSSTGDSGLSVADFRGFSCGPARGRHNTTPMTAP